MDSAEGTLPALYILMALLCIPPLLSLRSTYRRYRYMRARQRPAGWVLAGAIVSALSVLVIAGMLAFSLLGLIDGGTRLGTAHAVAVGLSWICFWIWLFVIIFVRRRRKRMLY